MYYEYYIAMPTRGRVDRQHTLNKLVPELRKYVNVYCHPGELLALSNYWDGKVASIQEYDVNCKNIGEIREYIIFNSQAKNVIFLDDNLRFQTTIKPSRNNLLKGSVFEMIEKNYFPEEILKMQIQIFDWMFEKLKNYAMCGLSFRPSNRGGIKGEKENCRLFGIWGINVKKYLSQEIRFSDWPIKEDFAVAISLIKNGYSTICTYDYSFDKSSGANSEGGCSKYRTIQLSNEIALKLQEMFPDWVKLKIKERKNWDGEFKGVESMDVIIYWNKIRKNET